ncbi:MAG TPA: helix-turn-helix transcriptional regulator, partial [Alcaligenes sp.]|nr:helix-turn-helix transcriptional regulator [Alcaligenes sp.]
MNKSVFSTMMQWAKIEGWSQSDLANRIGVSPQNITNWKIRGVPSDRHAQIAALFGKTVDQLLGNSPTGTAGTHTWPFAAVDEQKLCALSPSDALRLESI